METIIKEARATTRTQSSMASTNRPMANGAVPPIKPISTTEIKGRKQFVIIVMRSMCLAANVKTRHIFSLEREELKVIDRDEIETNVEADEKTIISSYAFARATSHQTMNVQCNKKKKGIIILIDSGSTHNFLDLLMATRTGRLIHERGSLVVVVADKLRAM